MITAARSIGLNEDNTVSFKGLSTDVKPIDKWNGISIENGSSFFEMDTQKIYFYDESSESWLG